jgi:glycosyltransferase involved in cell wall biosynthesis
MDSSFKVTYVIPCYNEGKKFPVKEYEKFISTYTDVYICFVNDASTDNSIQILSNLKSQFPSQIKILDLSKNLGKAEAVRSGINYCTSKINSTYIGFLDADLAVSLEEGYQLLSYFRKPIDFVFGSRILRLGSTIDRKRYRFIIGRIIATIISEILGIKVYDTQCGSKFFHSSLAPKLFDQPFISKWLFDVEIFFRMLHLFGKDEALKKMYEIPLQRWIERGDSKVKFSYIFKIGFDLYYIKKKYK